MSHFTAALIVLAAMLAPQAALGAAPPQARAAATKVAGAPNSEASIPYPGYRLERRAMWTLGSWAGLNMISGAVGLAVSDDPRWRGFHEMNIGWNVVNLGLAGFSLLTLEERAASAWAAYKRSKRLESILLVNVGVDVAYLVAGGWLWHHGRERGDPRRHGWGQSLVVQGGALLLFDAIFAWRQSNITEQLARRLRERP